MILNPTFYNDEEIQRIIDLNLKWDDMENEELKNFKKNLRQSLKSNIYCPYCRRRLQRKNYDQIDHIIFKADYDHYTFQPLNLVLACRRCNNNKLNNNVLLDDFIDEFKDLTWKEYPENGTYFKIIHPYYDDYSQHMATTLSIFYKPISGSEKALNTIEMMNLFGFDLLEENARSIMDTSMDFVSLSLFIKDTECDKELISWAGFLMIDNVIQNELFNILVAFERSDTSKPIIVEADYVILKNKILSDADEREVTFDIGFSASAKYIKLINKIDDVDMLKKFIEALELLYKMKNLDKSFEAALFLSLIVLVKLKDNKYTKKNLKKYLASQNLVVG